MSKKFVRVPFSITLEGDVLIELQEGESLETLDKTELEKRAIAEFEYDYEEFYDSAEITETEVGVDYAYYDKRLMQLNER